MQLYILTGPIAVGKTSLCWRLAARLRKVGRRPCGLLELAVLDDSGQKAGIALLDIDSNEVRTLARSDRNLGGPRAGRFSFARETLAWRRDIICRYPACELLILDEVGPLEFAGEEGTGVIWAALGGQKVARVLLVVRERYVAAAVRELADVEHTIFSLRRDRRGEAERKLWAMLGLDVSHS